MKINSDSRKVEEDKFSSSPFANARAIEEVLSRRVDKILPTKAELKSLMQKKKIRLYLGIDPTGTKLHLGHSVALRKLQEFAELGHESILLVGTGTVLAGDPSGRDKARAHITEKEIKKNIATWKKQASKILDFSKIKIKYNGDWLLKLNLKGIIEIASKISSIRLFKRDMFQKRIKRGETVWMHETLYPLLQGYDSVAMDVDLEIGGTDQTFNMLIGRELQRKMKNREKLVLTVPMVLGIDGNQMSKTSGNCVWLSDSPKEMFGKIMSIPDKLIISYFEMLTNIPIDLVKQYKKELKLKKINPMILKEILGFEIVQIYYSKTRAKIAQSEFARVFKQKKLPKKIIKVTIKKKTINIVELLVKTKLVSSKTEAKRLISQKGVKIDGKVKIDWKTIIKIKKGQIIQVGKRRFAKIK